MNTFKVRKCWKEFVLVLFAMHLIFSGNALGEGSFRVNPGGASPQKLDLTVGKSIVIETETVKRVSLGAPEIADALVVTPRQISLVGKAPGITNLTLWGLDNKIFAVFDLEVIPDISRLKKLIEEIFPEEGDIDVGATHSGIVLTGAVSKKANLSKIVALAEPFFPKKVVSFLKVKGPPEMKGSVELIKGNQITEVKFEGGD